MSFSVNIFTGLALLWYNLRQAADKSYTVETLL